MNKIYFFTIVVFLSLQTVLFANISSFEQEKNLPSFEVGLPKKIVLQQNDSFFYSTLGIGLSTPLAGLGLGYRHKFDKNVLDISADLTTAFKATKTSMRCNYLRYFKNDFYIGGGLDLMMGFVTYHPLFLAWSPVLSFGKENEKSFHEVGVNVLNLKKDIPLHPSISYRYGHKF